ncbi:MAG TPA: zinc-binding alcohol dehydrogenase family protein [Cytophagales bacterium]
MRTIILQEPGRFVYADQPADVVLQPGEALVKVGRIGICGTDLHAFRGRQPFFTYPRILGHELGVEVVETAGPAGGLQAGDRCAVEPYLNCGACIACRRGKPNCCTTLRVLGVHTDGGMREFLVVPAAKLHTSASLSLEQLALVETLGIGAHAVDRAAPTPDDTVLVVGAGPIGLAVTQFAQRTGAAVAVVDQNAARLDFCRRQMGVQHTLPAGEDLIPSLTATFGGDLPTVVFDATGNAAAMRRALDYAAPGGRVVYVGLFQGDVTFPDPLFHRKELTLLASRNATPGDFTGIIRHMEAGLLNTTPWITHRVPFGEMVAAFPGWLDPASGVIKALVEV